MMTKMLMVHNPCLSYQHQNKSKKGDKKFRKEAQQHYKISRVMKKQELN